MLSQKEKNQMISKIERRLEKLEQKMLDIGLDRNDPINVSINEKLIAEYESLQNRISYIQFHM